MANGIEIEIKIISSNLEDMATGIRQSHGIYAASPKDNIKG